MNALVAWRMLTHEKGRNILAVGGIFIAERVLTSDLHCPFAKLDGPAGGPRAVHG